MDTLVSDLGGNFVGCAKCGAGALRVGLPQAGFAQIVKVEAFLRAQPAAPRGVDRRLRRLACALVGAGEVEAKEPCSEAMKDGHRILGKLLGAVYELEARR